jgi:addiction module HigA family antidote
MVMHTTLKSQTITERPPFPPVHPGEILSEELDVRGISASRLARDLDVPANRITEIVAGRRAVTADTALRLAAFLGTSARFWLNLQATYDLAVLDGEKGEEIARRVRNGHPAG